MTLPPVRAVMSERRTAWLAALLVGLGPMCLPLFAPALPDLTAHFQTGDGTGKAALTVYMAGFLSMQLVGGPLSDRIGRRPVAMIFAVVFVLASLATLSAPDVHWFLTARLFQGIGASAGVAVGRAIILDQFPAGRAVPVMTLVSLLLAVAPALAPVIGAAAAGLGGWRATLDTMLLLGLIQILAIRLWMAETRPEGPARPLRQVGVDYARMLRDPRFLWPTLGAAGASMAFQMQAVVLPFLLVDRLGLPEIGFGLVMLVVSLSYILGNVIARRILRHHPANRPIALGVAVFLTASVTGCLLSLLMPATVWSVVLPVALSGVGGAMFFPGLISFALLPFQPIAGAAAAMNMFVQLATVLMAAFAVSAISDPAMGLAASFTLAATVTLAGWLAWHRLPGGPGEQNDSSHPFER